MRWFILFLFLSTSAWGISYYLTDENYKDKEGRIYINSIYEYGNQVDAEIVFKKQGATNLNTDIVTLKFSEIIKLKEMLKENESI